MCARNKGPTDKVVVLLNSSITNFINPGFTKLNQKIGVYFWDDEGRKKIGVYFWD